jgi:AcrR family transcriptional regulator
MGRKKMTEKKDEQKTKRAYHSPRRQEQAQVTKQRIVQAASEQLKEKGYANMTLESIARQAGVSPQTVYAVCGSKKGILAAIQETFVEANKYDIYRDAIPTLKTGLERVKAIGYFMSLLLENFPFNFPNMGGMGMVSPDLAEMEKDFERMIFEKNMGQIRQMEADGLLRPGLDIGTATEVYWAIGSPEVYRRLASQGWDQTRYARWVADLLAYMLLDPSQNHGQLSSWRDAGSFPLSPDSE